MTPSSPKAVSGAVDYLRSWFIQWTKHKDLILRRIEKIETMEGKTIIHMKDKEVQAMIETRLETAIPKLTQGWIQIVTLHNDENKKILIKEWETFIQFPKLTLFFINPFSKGDTRWTIHPYTHQQICDPDSLKTGLSTMGELVDPLTPEELEVKIRD
ncbi:MAG: hypothetical protein ABIH34_03025 [Nanoarchaeota archaeon]